MHRRDLLSSIAVAGTAPGLGGVLRAQTAGEKGRPGYTLGADLAGLGRLPDYQNRRSSGYDRTGGNAHLVSIASGETITLLGTMGPGVVHHIWFTVNLREAYHLKKFVLWAYCRSDNSYSTAYTFQTESHLIFRDLPKPEARISRVIQVGGPAPVRFPADK